VNDLGTYALPVSRRFGICIICRVDRKGTQFIDNKQTSIQTLNFIQKIGAMGTHEWRGREARELERISPSTAD